MKFQMFTCEAGDGSFISYFKEYQHSIFPKHNDKRVVSLNVMILNTLRPRQNGRHFADDTFKRIFLNKYVRISIKISLKFVPKNPINNIPALVHIMAWCRPGDKPLSEPMMVVLPTHICVARPQWVNNPGGKWSLTTGDVWIAPFLRGMYCMLNTFHVSSRTVTSNSESSLLLSQ